jgi:hypothetical protein
VAQVDPDDGTWMRDTDPWLLVATGADLSDLQRSNALADVFTWRTKGLVRDEELRQRYKAAGIEHVFLVVAVVDPDTRIRRPYFRRRGDQLHAEADFADDVTVPPGEELDIWLEPKARKVLENYSGLRKR